MIDTVSIATFAVLEGKSIRAVERDIKNGLYETHQVPDLNPNEHFIPIRIAAMLGDVSVRTIERNVKKGLYVTRQSASRSQSGKFITEIAVKSLPIEWQAKLMEGANPDMLRDTPPEQEGKGQTSLSPKRMTPEEELVWYDSLPTKHRKRVDKKREMLESIEQALAINASLEETKKETLDRLCRMRGISHSTYYLWQKTHKDQGLAGLANGRFGQSRSKLTEDQINYIKALIRFNPDCRDTRLWEYVIDEFPANPVSGSTVSRYVKAWKKNNPDVFAYLSNPEKWKSNFQLAFGSQSEKAQHFLHYIELDSTPADVMCLDGKRYTIIGGIDIFSRKIKCYVSPSSSGMGVAALIRSIIIDWGVPENFVRDNGKDYVCNQINLILETLGIKAITLQPFTPEGKPHIERFFRTMATCLFEETAGYVGHNVADRKAIESRRTFAQRLMKQGSDSVKVDLMPEDLQALIDRWIENIYNHREHGGIKTTPENKATQSTMPVRRIEDERALDILLLPAGIRTIGKKGIAFENAFYRSTEFSGWVGKEVRVRRDIDNAGRLYVFDLENRFITMATDSRIDTMTSAEYQATNKEQKRIVKEKVNAIDVLTENPMMRRINKSQAGKTLVGLSRTEIHSTPALDQAGNAALERNGIKPPKYKTIAEQMNDGEPFDDSLGPEDDDPLDFMEGIRIVNE